jgi:hypothetical protein
MMVPELLRAEEMIVEALTVASTPAADHDPNG